jgi:hypothetical protein
VLEMLEIPRSIWHEFADLSMDAQHALVDAVRAIADPSISPVSTSYNLDSLVLSDGIEGSIDALGKHAQTQGLSPVDFARHRTQIEEMDGERFVILDRLCTLPASRHFNQLDVFQQTFGVQLEDPMLLKWWIRAQRSALKKTLAGSISRAIYPRDQIREYIHTGRWGTNLTFTPEQVRRHVQATINLLRSCPTYQVGLAEQPAPLRMIGKPGAGVLVMKPVMDGNRDDGSGGMALRFSETEVVDRFTDHFNEVWNSIPEELRSNDSVATWLENELAEAGIRERSGTAEQ